MIKYEEALEKILANAEACTPKRRPINKILGLGLAEPIVAPFDQPRFDNSSVDGFGVKVSDIENASAEKPVNLALIDTIKAGDNKNISLKSGQTIKLLTGSAVPNGVEAIVMREFCKEEEQSIQMSKPVKPSENIRPKAAEFSKGQEVLQAGLRITPPIIGLLATLGYSSCLVGDKPKVSIVITGDELIKPGRRILPGKIYDANSFSLKAALSAIGIEKVFCHFTADKYEQTKKTLKQALDQSDILISSGGVSVGDFDFVGKALEELGVKKIIWKIAIKPGSPVYFGILENKKQKKLIFGLPGNPVSVLVTFHQFVKPVILKMMSINIQQEPVKAIVTKKMTKPTGKLNLLRAHLSLDADGKAHVQPKDGQESHMLGALATANSLIQFPAEDAILESGKVATIEKLSWFE